MRQTPILVLVVLAMIATVGAAEAELEAEPGIDESGVVFEAEYSASEDAAVTEGILASAFGIPFVDGYSPVFVFTFDQSTEATPSESAFADVLSSVMVPIEEQFASTETTQAVSEELIAVREEGVGVGTQTSADAEGVAASADIEAGTQSVNEEVSASAPEPAAGLAAPDLGLGPQAPAPEEPAVDEAPQSFPGPLAVSSDFAVPIDPASPELVATSIAVAGMTTTTLLVSPGARTLLVRWLRRVLGLSLFSRIAQEDILSHGRRAELFEYIKQNPGERIENARRALGISNGSMHYHLKVLTDRNLIRILRDGGLARLYPAGPKINPAPYVPAQRRRFVDLLSSRPGVTQREAATLLGISERMASYHINTMADQGLVEVRPEGARKRLFLRCESAPTPMAS